MRCCSNRSALERDILPAYLAKRRWFALKDQALHAVRLASLAPLPHAELELLLAEIETETQGGIAQLVAAAGDRLGRPADRAVAGAACPGAGAARRARRSADRCVRVARIRQWRSGRVWRAGHAGRRDPLRTDIAHGRDGRSA